MAVNANEMQRRRPDQTTLLLLLLMSRPHPPDSHPSLSTHR